MIKLNRNHILGLKLFEKFGYMKALGLWLECAYAPMIAKFQKKVMEMPMTLPSGHTVDRSTLDK